MKLKNVFFFEIKKKIESIRKIEISKSVDNLYTFKKNQIFHFEKI